MKFSTVLAVLAIVSGASAATPDVVHLTGDIAASDDAAETTVQYKTLLRSTPNVPEATSELSSDSSNTPRGALSARRVLTIAMGLMGVYNVWLTW